MPSRTYAKLCLSTESEAAIRQFFVQHCGIRRKFVQRKPHLTVYFAPLELRGLREIHELVNIEVDTAETKFMVMGPGGENSRPELDPAQNIIGIRLTRRNLAREKVLSFRRQLYPFEQTLTLKKRRPTDDLRNAFGARRFQPHITLLHAGSGISRDLQPYGQAFRERITSLKFDYFVIEIRSDASAPPGQISLLGAASDYQLAGWKNGL